MLINLQEALRNYSPNMVHFILIYAFFKMLVNDNFNISMFSMKVFLNIIVFGCVEIFILIINNINIRESGASFIFLKYRYYRKPSLKVPWGYKI